MFVYDIKCALIKYSFETILKRVFANVTLLLLATFPNVPSELCVSEILYLEGGIFSAMCCEVLTFLNYLEALRIFIESIVFALIFLCMIY